jgi:hypothetical protein
MCVFITSLRITRISREALPVRMAYHQNERLRRLESGTAGFPIIPV